MTKATTSPWVSSPTEMRSAPDHRMATTPRSMTRKVAGLSTAESLPTAMAVSAWSFAAATKRFASLPSRLNARMTRTPERASRQMTETLSSFACIMR